MKASRLFSALGLAVAAVATAAFDFLALLYRPAPIWISVFALTLAFVGMALTSRRPLLSPLPLILSGAVGILL
ncbi:MAG TPA: hypothetical protein VFN88_13520, partial [Caulobacteraceae bacterium]|nr:hypothetical protein [Caulobacteraceae bacterium]